MTQQPVVPNDPFGPIKKPASQDLPSAQEVNRFHTNADTDSAVSAIHHTLGTKHTQAAMGDHNHNLKNQTLTGSKGGNVALANLITMLSDAFGFIDGTT